MIRSILEWVGAIISAALAVFIIGFTVGTLVGVIG